MLGTILIVVVILMLLGALPTWPHSRQWGYHPRVSMLELKQGKLPNEVH